jgi:phosphoglycerol transferase
MIRCYNRITVFIGLLSLLAVAMLLDRVARRAQGPWSRVLYVGLLVILLVGGTQDQFPRHLRPDYAALGDQFAADAEFIGRIEKALPEGAGVFQLPMVCFPESTPVGGVASYDHFRGYLHSRRLCWSFGCMKGRSGDRWYQAAAKLPPDEMLKQLVSAGFSGVYVNRTGYPDGGAALEADLTRLLGAAPEVSRDGCRSFFKLVDYARPEKSSETVAAAKRQSGGIRGKAAEYTANETGGTCGVMSGRVAP